MEPKHAYLRLGIIISHEHFFSCTVFLKICNVWCNGKKKNQLITTTTIINNDINTIYVIIIIVSSIHFTFYIFVVLHQRTHW